MKTIVSTLILASLLVSGCGKPTDEQLLHRIENETALGQAHHGSLAVFRGAVWKVQVASSGSITMWVEPGNELTTLLGRGDCVVCDFLVRVVNPDDPDYNATAAIFAKQ